MPDATTNPLNCQLLLVGANRGTIRARQVFRCNRLSICAVLACLRRNTNQAHVKTRKELHSRLRLLHRRLPAHTPPVFQSWRPVHCCNRRGGAIRCGRPGGSSQAKRLAADRPGADARHDRGRWLGLRRRRLGSGRAKAEWRAGAANGIFQGAMLPRGGQAAANRRPSRPGVALRSRRQDSSRDQALGQGRRFD